MQNIEVALEIYALEHGHYPASLENLVSEHWISGERLQVPGAVLRYRPETSGARYSLAVQSTQR
jgi:hypothetical protein